MKVIAQIQWSEDWGDRCYAALTFRDGEKELSVTTDQHDEPLLYKEFKDAVVAVRALFPEAEVWLMNIDEEGFEIPRKAPESWK